MKNYVVCCSLHKSVLSFYCTTRLVFAEMRSICICLSTYHYFKTILIFCNRFVSFQFILQHLKDSKQVHSSVQLFKSHFLHVQVAIRTSTWLVLLLVHLFPLLIWVMLQRNYMVASNILSSYGDSRYFICSAPPPKKIDIIQMMNVYECNDTNIYIMRWKMLLFYSMRRGEAELKYLLHYTNEKTFIICLIWFKF